MAPNVDGDDIDRAAVSVDDKNKCSDIGSLKDIAGVVY